MKVCIHRRVGSIGSTIYVCMHACMHVLFMYVCMHAIWLADPYVYIDAPIILGVLYMYVCMHVCMHYVCMYDFTPIGAPFGAPIANRRADRRVVWYRCVPS